jgi:hypothetical protein
MRYLAALAIWLLAAGAGVAARDLLERRPRSGAAEQPRVRTRRSAVSRSRPGLSERSLSHRRDAPQPPLAAAAKQLPGS